jgi:hypothetical protein
LRFDVGAGIEDLETAAIALLRGLTA